MAGEGIAYELLRLRTRDRGETTEDQPAPESRPVVTAMVFGRR